MQAHLAEILHLVVNISLSRFI